MSAEQFGLSRRAAIRRAQALKGVAVEVRPRVGDNALLNVWAPSRDAVWIVVDKHYTRVLDDGTPTRGK